MYNTCMRFEVPQFIEIEEKIFGPFTWKQFIYLGGGVGTAAVILFTMPFIVFVLFGVPVAALGAALAFYPINNRPFSIFLESMWRFYKANRTYYWRKRTDIVYNNTSETSGSSHVTPPTRGSGGINSLSRKLELKALQTNQ